MLTRLVCSFEGGSYSSFVKNLWAHLASIKFYYIKLSFITIVVGRDIMHIYDVTNIIICNVEHFREVSAPAIPQYFIH